MSYWLRRIFAGYTLRLEEENAELRRQLAEAREWERGIQNSMLANLGLPTVRPEGKAESFEPTGGVVLPSQWKRQREFESRRKAEQKRDHGSQPS